MKKNILISALICLLLGSISTASAQHFSIFGLHLNFDFTYSPSPIVFSGPGPNDISEGDGGLPIIISPQFGYRTSSWNDGRGSRLGHHIGFEVGVPLSRFDLNFGFRWIQVNSMPNPRSEWNFGMKSLLNQPNVKIFAQTYTLGFLMHKESVLTPRIYTGMALNNVRSVNQGSPYSFDDFASRQVPGVLLGLDLEISVLSIGLEGEWGLKPLLVAQPKSKSRSLSAIASIHF